MKVKIVGNGAFGKAIFSVISSNTKNVSFAKRGEVISDADVVILAVPTKALREVFKLVKSKDPIIINCVKGIEQSSHKLPFQIVKELKADLGYFSLIGPSFANEIVDKMPTLVNVGYIKNKDSNKVKQLLQTDHFRIRLSKSVGALEIAGAFKNVYAIGCGIAAGLGFRVNTRTKLIMIALEEIHGLCKKLNFDIDKDSMPGIVGDLVLTCSSMESRNYRFGQLITEYSVEESLEKIKETVEGYTTVNSVDYFTKTLKIKLPLASFIREVIKRDDPKTVREDLSNFVSNV